MGVARGAKWKKWHLGYEKRAALVCETLFETLFWLSTILQQHNITRDFL